MVNISAAGIQSGRDSLSAAASAVETQQAVAAKASAIEAPAGAGAVSDNVVISTLAGRLSKAETATSASLQGLGHDALASRVNDSISRILYPLDTAHKAAAAQQEPQPNDAASAKSAAAATAYIDGRGKNPFAGLSRDQLATIAYDESGTFTVNERRAAYYQAGDDEQAWRQQVVAQAMHEYDTTGKMTDFFKSVLAHFNDLPKLEQAQYPEQYASGLEDKIKLDFNYFNHAPGDAAPTPGSLASMARQQGVSPAQDLFAMLGPEPRRATAA